ncbi:helix-turn-helix domain-containing protein [Curtobacterium sp. MCBD17_019]|uniref:helix-turn-helix domain-containing protein n=1 Tax=Curtobacterium sp. MCBD17_019 TaxID=2175669 RepID=UPI0015E89E79
MTRKQQDEIVALYESGLSTRAVAERVGLGKTTVLRALGLAGITIRPRGNHGRQ